MGSGKSLTARRLAQLLKRKSVSIDELIEAREGRPIKQIFAESGESYFRDKEQEVVLKMAKLIRLSIKFLLVFNKILYIFVPPV